MRSIFLKIIYPFFVLLSFIVPRNNKLWVFGNQKKYFDSTRYFFEYVSSKDKNISCYWLANNNIEANEVLNCKFKTVQKNSFQGYWISARAGCSFICNGFSDINRLLALKSNVINFWHGTPIKKIYLDSKHDLSKFGSSKISIYISKILMKYLNSHIDIYYASNSFEQKMVTRASGIPIEKSVVLGSPRFDTIRNVKRPATLPNGNIILYAPTWRENGFKDSSFFINDDIYNDLSSFLDNTSSYLIIKPHPLTQSKELINLGLKKSTRILYSEDLEINDINIIYPFCNYLITDLSSSMFDYLIFNKPLILFMPDVNEYMNGERGIYKEFHSVYHSHDILRNWNSLIFSLTEKSFVTSELFFNITKEVSSKKNVSESILIDIKEKLFKK